MDALRREHLAGVKRIDGVVIDATGTSTHTYYPIWVYPVVRTNREGQFAELRAGDVHARRFIPQLSTSRCIVPGARQRWPTSAWHLRQPIFPALSEPQFDRIVDVIRD